jgi:hypothetical protein
MLARWLKCVAVAAVAAGLWSGGTAMASDPYYYAPTYSYKKVVTHETVTSFETRTEAYQVVVKHNNYGCAYNAYETRYRYVDVPVYKTVAVTKYVKVPSYNYGFGY